MTALFPKKDDTLTTRNIIDAYVAAYHSVHELRPDCESIDGRWFMVQGVRRDRRWMVLEVERLRQEALSRALDDTGSSSSSNLFKLIRRLSRI